jgi:hypothetical protein
MPAFGVADRVNGLSIGPSATPPPRPARTEDTAMQMLSLYVGLAGARTSSGMAVAKNPQNVQFATIFNATPLTC